MSTITAGEGAGNASGRTSLTTSPKDAKVQVGPIAGLVGGVVAVVALCVTLAIFFHKRRARKLAQNQPHWGTAYPYDIKTRSQVLPLHLDDSSWTKHAPSGSMSSSTSPTRSSFGGPGGYHYKPEIISVPSQALPPPISVPNAISNVSAPRSAPMPAHQTHRPPPRNMMTERKLVAPSMLRNVSDAPSALSLPRTVSRQGSFVNEGDEMAPSGFFLETSRATNRLQLPPDGSPRTSDGGHGWWDTSIIDLRLEIDDDNEDETGRRSAEDGRAVTPVRPQIPILKTTPPSMLLLTPPNPPWPHTPNLPYTPSAPNTPIVSQTPPRRYAAEQGSSNAGGRIRSPSLDSLEQREFRNAFNLVTANGTFVPMTSVPSPSVEMRRTPFF